MKKTRFLISSLLAAGLGGVTDAQASVTRATMTGGDDDPNQGGLMRLFKLDHMLTLADHRSHSSHSSHSSHRSSSGGGTSTYSYPTYSAPAQRIVTPAPPPLPAPPRRSLYATPPSQTPPISLVTPPSTPQRLRGGTEKFTSIVRRVQLGLLAYGYYSGPIDGVVGTTMRTSLRQFQTDFKLPVTGTITPETLDSLKITAE
jgi:His-Xaa-Ser repeat protein HxsA